MIQHRHTTFGYRTNEQELGWFTFTVTNLDTGKDVFTSLRDYGDEALAKEHAAMFIDYFCRQ